jgi:general nucleoside transport system ATP-binding protein
MLAVQMQDIVKRFSGTTANDHVSFELKEGEIHALLGENGAGKTTLMRILYGLYHYDEGTIHIQGKPAHIRTPKDAIQLGIGMVTQHFTLVPTLTVAENLALGQPGRRMLNPQALHKEAEQLSSHFGISIKPTSLVRHLSVGEQQRIEILKALSHHARVLILDEPTAVLVPQEVDVLFESLTRLRAEGLSIIFISHKLNEVMAVCDQITVLRDGRVVGTTPKSSVTKQDLAHMMVGRESQHVIRQGERQAAPILLQVDNLTARNRKGLDALRGVSFQVEAGEILGIAGVSGNGQTELSQILSGMIKPSSGKIVVEGKEVSHASPAQFAAAGVGCIPEDRHSGIVGELSVAENLVLDQLNSFASSGMLNQKNIQENARKQISAYQIKAAPADRARTLSGGNMQKVILARALSRSPKVIIASQPTRGLDLGATEYVRAKLMEQRGRGAAILLISEDLDEIMALADRIAVIYEGQIIGILPGNTAPVDQLGLMMSGHTIENTPGNLELQHV